jgi:hypothetical protein
VTFVRFETNEFLSGAHSTSTAENEPVTYVLVTLDTIGFVLTTERVGAVVGTHITFEVKVVTCDAFLTVKAIAAEVTGTAATDLSLTLLLSFVGLELKKLPQL